MLICRARLHKHLWCANASNVWWTDTFSGLAWIARSQHFCHRQLCAGLISITLTWLMAAKAAEFAFADGERRVSRVVIAVFVEGVPGHRVVCQTAVSNGAESHPSRSRVRLLGWGEGRRQLVPVGWAVRLRQRRRQGRTGCAEERYEQPVAISVSV